MHNEMCKMQGGSERSFKMQLQDSLSLSHAKTSVVKKVIFLHKVVVSLFFHWFENGQHFLCYYIVHVSALDANSSTLGCANVFV